MNYRKRRNNNICKTNIQKIIKFIFILIWVLIFIVILLIINYLLNSDLHLKNTNLNTNINQKIGNEKISYIVKNNNITNDLNINPKKALILTKAFKKEKLRIFKHNSLILRLSEYSNIEPIIKQNIGFFKRPDNNSLKSVFIFRNKYNLTSSKIKEITNYISKLDKDILFFIDQEWWKINRYIDFNKIDLDIINNLITKNINKNNSWVILWVNSDYLNLNLDFNKDNFLITRLNFLDKEEWEILKNLLNNKYFPSLWDIWKSYNLIWDLDLGIDLNNYKKNIFLEIIAYIRLKELNKIWINTYWLVLDLDRWNPVITDLSRSFSNNIQDYKILINSFKVANKNFNIKIYFKHFPWHWIWDIDSHKWILDLTWNIEYSKYLEESIELFDYWLKQIELSGLMIWHMIIWNEFNEDFDRLINKSSFIITDDLWMQWFKKIRDTYYKKKEFSFFTTNKVLNLDNIIIINTVNSKIE